MAFDEAAQLHEKLNYAVKQIVAVEGYLFYAWVVPVGTFAILLFLSYISFLKRIPFAVSKVICLGGFLYISGALGMEMIAGNMASIDPHAKGAMAWRIAMTLEEALEMSGVIFFASAIITYIDLDRRPNADHDAPGPRIY